MNTLQGAPTAPVSKVKRSRRIELSRRAASRRQLIELRRERRGATR